LVSALCLITAPKGKLGVARAIRRAQRTRNLRFQISKTRLKPTNVDKGAQRQFAQYYRHFLNTPTGGRVRPSPKKQADGFSTFLRAKNATRKNPAEFSTASLLNAVGSNKPQAVIAFIGIKRVDPHQIIQSSRVFRIVHRDRFDKD
jgi:hypothetical protein